MDVCYIPTKEKKAKLLIKKVTQNRYTLSRVEENIVKIIAKMQARIDKLEKANND